MEPLDLSKTALRGPREKLLGLCFLPRTIDKMRANLPGGNLNGYVVDFPAGMSAFMLKRVGVDQAAMQAAVASAKDEPAFLAWFEQNADLSGVEALNAKMEALTITALPDDFQQRVHVVHPGLAERPDITHFFDIFEHDDERVAAGKS